MPRTRTITITVPERVADKFEVLCEARNLDPSSYLTLWVVAATRNSTRPYGLVDPLRFGKYEGIPFGDVIKGDPKYVLWCIDNLEKFSMTPDAVGLLQIMLGDAMEEAHAPGWSEKLKTMFFGKKADAE